MQQATADIEKAIEQFEKETQSIKEPERKKTSISLASFEKIKSQLQDLS